MPLLCQAGRPKLLLRSAVNLRRRGRPDDLQAVDLPRGIADGNDQRTLRRHAQIKSADALAVQVLMLGRGGTRRPRTRSTHRSPRRLGSPGLLRLAPVFRHPLFQRFALLGGNLDLAQLDLASGVVIAVPDAEAAHDQQVSAIGGQFVQPVPAPLFAVAINPASNRPGRPDPQLIDNQPRLAELAKHIVKVAGSQVQ